MYLGIIGGIFFELMHFVVAQSFPFINGFSAYSFLEGIGETAAGLTTQELKEVVLVDVEEVLQISYLME